MANDMMVKELDQVVVRFSGDSGDGMQLAGNIFSTVSATVGNDISTFPDYPADIRAPQGSIYLDVSFIVLYFALVVLESVVLIVF